MPLPILDVKTEIEIGIASAVFVVSVVYGLSRLFKASDNEITRRERTLVAALESEIAASPSYPTTSPHGNKDQVSAAAASSQPDPPG